jgi:prevent-host-death family protein
MHKCQRMSRPAHITQSAERLNISYNKAIIALMKKASITEAKNNLSALIDGLANGSPVLIVDRGRPVARLEPAERDVSHLVRLGIVRQRRASPARTLFTTPPPRANASALAALIEERREDR